MSYVGVNLQFLTPTVQSSNPPTSTPPPAPPLLYSPVIVFHLCCLPPVTKFLCSLLCRRTAFPLSPTTWAAASSLFRGKTSKHTGRGHLQADSGADVKPLPSQAGVGVCVCMEMYSILKAHRLCCQRCCQALLKHAA